MAKKNGNKVSKKNYPGLERVKNSEGVRVWRYKGVDHNSLRELDMVTNPMKYFGGSVKFTPADGSEVVEGVVEPSGDIVDDVLPTE